MLKNNLQEIVDNMIQNLVVKTSLNFDSEKQFLTSLTEKLEIYDPLDTKFIFENNEDQGLKTAEFKELIEAMPSMDSSNLCAPMPSKTAMSFETLIESELKECDTVCNRYIQQAKDQGEKFVDKIENDPILKKYDQNLQFLKNNKLIRDIDKHIQKLQTFLKVSNERILRAKKFKEFNKEEKEIYQLIEEVHQYLTKQIYSSVA